LHPELRKPAGNGITALIAVVSSVYPAIVGSRYPFRCDEEVTDVTKKLFLQSEQETSSLENLGECLADPLAS
jgi:hypothetical protein